MMNSNRFVQSGEGGAATTAPLLGLDIGGTKIAGAIVALTDTHANISHQASVPTDAGRGGATVLATILDFAKQLLATAREEGIEPRGIAVSSAGVIDPVTGAIASATDTMPGWAGQPLGPALRAHLSLPVAVLNDVHGHGLGEVAYGAGRGAQNALIFAVGTGLGGAAIVGGKLVSGANGVSGHFGHLYHETAHGLTCSCGRTSHIETAASGSGAARLYAARQIESGTLTDEEIAYAEKVAGSITGVVENIPEEHYEVREDRSRPALVRGGFELKQLADQGDEFARQIFIDGAFALGQTIAGLANSFDPDVIILSGSLTHVGAYWWNALHKGFMDQAMNLIGQTLVIEGSLDSSAPLIGAAVYFDSIMNDDEPAHTATQNAT